MRPLLFLAAALALGCSAPESRAHAFEPPSALAPAPALTQSNPATGPVYNFVGDWSEAERSIVLEAFDEWPKAINHALDIYHVTPSEAFDDKCPVMTSADGGTYLGYTYSGADPHMCIYTVIPSILPKVAAHEYGHALGLVHYTGAEPSLMKADIEDAADVPQAVDLEALAAE